METKTIIIIIIFGDGNENRESACSCSLIHSKFIRHGRCWWDGWWELEVVLQCRHFLHKPKADFENTKARAQKASTHKSTHKRRTKALQKAQKAEKHESTRAREHESTRAREQRNTSEPKASETLCALITAALRHYPESSTHRERAEKAGYPDGALLVWVLTAIGWRHGRKISVG